MRLIGHLKNEGSAKTLADYLVSVDIGNLIEPDAEGWAVWIRSEDQIEAGQRALSEYVANPTEAKFQQAAQKASDIAEQQKREKTAFNSRFRTPDRIWRSATMGRVTLALIVISVVVTVLSNFLGPFSVYDWVVISQYTGHSLPEVFHGQIWRLLTPIFLHFGVAHILFDMLMLRDMGSLIEMRQNSRTLLFLVLVIGVGSNLGQYYYKGGGFGGMSGVVYGLFGYIWLRGRFDPASGLTAAPSTVAVMLGWFVLCVVGVIPNVANGCHVFGLLLGMLIGAWPVVKRSV